MAGSKRIAKATARQNTPACPVREAIELVSRRWALHVLRALAQGEKKRFSELLRETDGLTPRTLSKRLKELERGGVVAKQRFLQVPPRTEYRLTRAGQELVACFASLDRWARKWVHRKASGKKGRPLATG